MAEATDSQPANERFLAPWLLALAVLATVAKLVLIATTDGTDDANKWSRFALYAWNHRSLTAGYAFFVVGDAHLFNHPPLGTLVMVLAVALGKLLGAPGILFWIRVPALVADLASAAALERLLRSRLDVSRRRLAVALYLASPLPAAVGVYHGNTDLVWVALLLWAAWALEDARPVLAGLLAGAAVAVKLPALVALAPLGAAALRAGKPERFVGGALTSAGPAYLLGLVGGGPAFVQAVLRYKGSLSAVPWPPGSLLVPLLGDRALLEFRLHGALVVLVAVLAGVALTRGRLRPGEALALALGTTLLVASTFGAQYLAWFAAPALLVGGRFALVFHAAAAAQALVIYTTPVPPFLEDPDHAGILSPWPGLATWLVLLVGIVFLVRLGSQEGAAPDAGASPAGGAASRA